MPKPALSANEVKEIINLRRIGNSLHEIRVITKRSNGTIWKYIKDVVVLPEYKDIWRAKRGGSKAKSNREWQESKKRASNILGKISFRDQMMILSCLYWGEGTKRELNVINSDPIMIKVIFQCLKELGIKNEEFKISLRLFDGINKRKAILFWSKTLEIPAGFIKKVNAIPGRKVGKLEYGMCRLRVKKGGRYFKLIMSMIDFIKLTVIKPS